MNKTTALTLTLTWTLLTGCALGSGFSGASYYSATAGQSDRLSIEGEQAIVARVYNMMNKESER